MSQQTRDEFLKAAQLHFFGATQHKTGETLAKSA